MCFDLTKTVIISSLENVSVDVNFKSSIWHNDEQNIYL